MPGLRVFWSLRPKNLVVAVGSRGKSRGARVIYYWAVRRDRIVLGCSGVRAIRQRTSLSQLEFAHLIGISVKTLQNWEPDRRRPTGPAAALLQIIAHEPRLAVKAIHRE